MSRLTGTDAYGLMEAYNNVYAPQELTEEQVWEEVETWVNSLVEEGYDLSDYTWEEMYESYLEEARTDPRGRPASGPMSVYGGRGQDAGPGGSGNTNVDRMDAAQRRVKATQPRGKGMAADALFTKYSARQKGMEHGGEEGPGPKAPKRSGRSGRGANTDRGSGNAAKRRMSEDFDLFDTILEHLVAEGYADTNEAALVIMANMSEEWRESIVEELEQLDEISLKTKMKAYAASRDVDADYNYGSKVHDQGDRIKKAIVKKHGEKAGEHAERSAETQNFGRGTPRAKPRIEKNRTYRTTKAGSMHGQDQAKLKSDLVKRRNERNND